MSYSGTPNYMGCRIQLHSDFNLALWEKKLKTYEDSNVVNLLHFGFPRGIDDRGGLNRKNIDHHSSAQQFIPQVKSFIEKEIKQGAMLGPFPHPPHALFHCCPMLTRPKDEGKRRVIVDL